MNYENGTSHGTVCGGYCSLIATFVIWMLTIAEIYTCFSNPVVYLSQSFSQLSVPNNVSYTITLESGFPAFYTYTQGSAGEEGTYNDPDLFEFSF